MFHIVCDIGEGSVFLLCSESFVSNNLYQIFVHWEDLVRHFRQMHCPDSQDVIDVFIEIQLMFKNYHSSQR